MEQQLTIDGCQVGQGLPPYLVAEIGINHNGDMALARQMINAAKASGADAVKFQSYVTEDFLSPDSNLTHEYTVGGKRVTESQFAMFKRCELSVEQLQSLSEYARKLGVGFHSTPTNNQGVTVLQELGVSVLKNGSDYLTHLPLIECMGKSGLATVLSVGMSTVEEIDLAVRVFRSTGNQKLILLHCTSSYPTPSNQINLRRIETLASTFGCLVGFSDHSEGVTAAAMAVSMGACWIEKHFTTDKALNGPDHAFSMDPAEFSRLAEACKSVQDMMGVSALGPAGCESISRHDYRLSCALARSMGAGEKIDSSDIVFQRPGNGIPPAHAYLLFGRVLSEDLPRGTTLKTEHLM